MRVEVVAVGTELLLGQIADTNSAWLGEQLAAAGIDSHFHQAVGDNQARIVLALRTALARSDAVIACGGLGPTQDDITREAIAEVMNVPLERDQGMVEELRALFTSRGREMPESNARQADVPKGATVIPRKFGTAPGLTCPLGHKVIYALPGVPYEMAEMFTRGVLPDLQRRLAEEGGPAVIASRVVRTWGLSESSLAETLSERIRALDDAGGNPTIAFLASGMEGMKVRVTAKAHDAEEASAMLDAEEQVLRKILGDRVFGTDDDTMESVVAGLLVAKGLTLAVAESLTGGMVASRLVGVPGASHWFRGGVVAYDSSVKRDILGVSEGPVVTAQAAREMAEGVRKALSSDVGLALTGVAGPDPDEGKKPGTVVVGLAMPHPAEPETVELELPGDRERVRQYATISALDLLRRRLT
jgi:nicotinamide-nucleotide amidase